MSVFKYLRNATGLSLDTAAGIAETKMMIL